MVWSHYIQEITNSETDEKNVGISGEDDDLNIPRNREMPYELWCTWYSTDLFNLWMTFKAYREDSGNERYLLDECSFGNFQMFCYNNSSKFPSKYPS